LQAKGTKTEAPYKPPALPNKLTKPLLEPPKQPEPIEQPDGSKRQRKSKYTKDDDYECDFAETKKKQVPSAKAYFNTSPDLAIGTERTEQQSE